jgi:hypothetical protein
MSSLSPLRCFLFLVLALGPGASSALLGQASGDSASRLLPNEPSQVVPAPAKPADPQPVSNALTPVKPDSLAGIQTKRILGIVPNFRSVSANQKLPPESVKDKFKESTEDAFDYSDLIFAGLLGGVAQAENSIPEFHHGVAAYGRYYWHSLADQADEDYQVEFFFPVLLHQDSRYYTLGRGGAIGRAGYAFSRVLITRTDSGNETVNASEIVGAGAASGISDLYYPAQERTWTKTGQRWLLNVGLDGFTFIFKEFWPDLNDRFFHQKN